jgi:hypothetical protein
VERQLEEKDSFEDITICRNLADLNKKQKKKNERMLLNQKGLVSMDQDAFKFHCRQELFYLVFNQDAFNFVL